MPKDIIADEARFGRNPRTRQTGFRVGKLGIWVEDATNPANAQFGQASDSEDGPTVINFKCRGTVEAPADPVADDHVSGLVGYAYSGGTWFDVGTIYHMVDAGGFVSGQRPPSRWEFHANAANDTPAARMKIFGNGTVYIGNSALAQDSNRKLHVRQSTGFTPVLFQNDIGGSVANVLILLGGDNSTSGSKFLTCQRPDGTEIGTIRQNAATTVAYNTSSDARLKEDVTESPIGVQEVNNIRVRRFRYKGDSAGRVLTGFIAQELHAVYPDAVTPSPDSTDCACDLVAGGRHVENCVHANPWGVDYGRLTPLLVKAIQEIDARLKAVGA